MSTPPATLPTTHTHVNAVHSEGLLIASLVHTEMMWIHYIKIYRKNITWVHRLAVFSFKI